MKTKIVTTDILDVASMNYDSDYNSVIGYLNLPQKSIIIDTNISSNILTVYALHYEKTKITEQLPVMLVNIGEEFSTTPGYDKYVLNMRDRLSNEEVDTILSNITPRTEFVHLVTNHQMGFMLFVRAYAFNRADLPDMTNDAVKTVLY